jgi:dephospho-CoA kinase
VSTNEPFAIVGLTGGIASGKTTVSEMFADRGVRIIDADAIAREVVEPGEPALEDIRETFGDEVIAADGSLDREALGGIVFDDEAARSRLEAITHPRIASRMMQKASDARESGEPWVVYDAALIVENDLHETLPALVVVAAARETQRARIVERDGLSPEEADARLDAQMPLEDKIAAADYVVDNDGALEATRRQVDRLYEVLDTGLDRYDTVDRDRLEDEGLIEADELTAG